MPETQNIEYKQQLTEDLEQVKSPNQNLTFEQLKIYYEGANKMLNQHFASNLELPTEDGQYNYAAYLLADTNGISVKVAKYDGLNRVDLVEYLGSGVPRILTSYGRECFKFTENFLRMTFPATEQVIPQVTLQVTTQVEELIKILDKEMNRQEIQEKLNLSDRENFRLNYLKPALEQGFVEMTLPDKPNSNLQKYRLTILGKQLR